MTLGVRVKTFY